LNKAAQSHPKAVSLAVVVVYVFASCNICVGCCISNSWSCIAVITALFQANHVTHVPAVAGSAVCDNHLVSHEYT